MKVRKGDRVEWKSRTQQQFEVVGFENRDVLIVDDKGGQHTVPARELTVVEKRTANP